ncbi:cysteine desulfurase [Candidatus Woesearchaeota archaeon]|nr:cysteine desulfurase [Candidatus Woesearchaeota archaeon]
MAIYLDNAATTSVDPEAVKAMLPWLTESYGNPASIHAMGEAALDAVEKSRETLARLLGCDASETIFTSGGTESNNLAVLGAARAAEKGTVICSAVEHPSVLEPVAQLQREGFKAQFVPVDKDAVVDVDALKSMISPETRLVSVLHANNEVGTIEPIDEIAALCSQNGALFHCDMVQSFRKACDDVHGIPLASLSAHKIHGPKGIGALVCQNSKLLPLMFGGKHERELRPGTLNVPGIVGFARAAERFTDEDVERIRSLGERLVNGLLQIPGTMLNGHPKQRLCNNVHVTFEKAEGEAILQHLSSQGIMVSTGSACTSRELKPSHVLLAMGRTAEQSHNSVRFTLGKQNTKEEIDTVIAATAGIVEQLHRVRQ